MAFKTISKNQQRWAQNNDRSMVSSKQCKQHALKWIRNRPERYVTESVKTNLPNNQNKAKIKAKKLSKMRQQYGNNVLLMCAYNLPIPDPPQKLRKEIGEMQPVEWVQTFYNWEKIFNHYLKQREAGHPIKSVQPCIIALRLPESYMKTVIHSFKFQIARALVLNEQMPGIPDVLKDEIKDQNRDEWFKSCPDHEMYLKKVKEKLSD